MARPPIVVCGGLRTRVGRVPERESWTQGETSCGFDVLHRPMARTQHRRRVIGFDKCQPFAAVNSPAPQAGIMRRRPDRHAPRGRRNRQSRRESFGHATSSELTHTLVSLDTIARINSSYQPLPWYRSTRSFNRFGFTRMLQWCRSTTRI